MADFNLVREQVNVLRFFETNGFKLRKVGTSIRSDACPVCGQGTHESNKLAIMSDLQHWKCFACGARGDVIDAASAIWRVSLKEAANRLVNNDLQAGSTPFAIKENLNINSASIDKIKKKTGEAISLIREKTKGIWNEEAAQYLEQSRCIPRNVLQKAIEQDVLGFLPFANQWQNAKWLKESIGEVLLVESNLLKPDKRLPAIAFRPVVLFLAGGTSAEFRMARDPKEGERKAIRYGLASQPWRWKGNEQEGVLVVEGAIDMLSAVALGWKGDIIGLPGASVFKTEWIDAYASKVVLCLDPDEAGMNAMRKIAHNLEQVQVQNVKISPPKNGDLNDLLRRKVVQAASSLRKVS